MDLKTLGYLVGIVESGSFLKAAHAFNVTQPALSRAMSQLESECGLQLLRRGRRGTRVALTSAGELVLRRGRVMLAERQELIAELGLIRTQDSVPG